MLSNKKILLVGGAGFIGSHLAKQLKDNGNEIAIIDPLLVASKIDDLWRESVKEYRFNEILDGFYIYENVFQEVGAKVIESWSPDIIVHLGALPLEGTGNEMVEHHQINNDTSLTYLVAYLSRKFDIEKLVYMSSVFAYGDTDKRTVDENQRINPTTPYGVSKASSEFIIKTIAPRWNIIRTKSVYGFGDLNMRATSVFMDRALKNKPFWVNKSSLLDYIYIDDLVDGIIKVIETDHVNEEFHISGGISRPLLDYVKELKKHIPDLDYEIKEIDDRPMRSASSNSKARRLLGWYPKVSLKDGVKKYFEKASQHNCG